MTDDIAKFFLDVHLSKVKLTSFLDGNCFLIASTLSQYIIEQWLLRVLADRSTNSLHNAFYDHCSLRFEIAFHEI